MVRVRVKAGVRGREWGILSKVRAKVRVRVRARARVKAGARVRASWPGLGLGPWL